MIGEVRKRSNEVWITNNIDINLPTIKTSVNLSKASLSVDKLSKDIP